MRRIKLIWLILFNKEFVNLLKETILYAFRVRNVVGGKNASIITNMTLYQSDILKNNELDKYYSEKKFKIPPESLLGILEKYTDDELDELKKRY